MQSEIPICAISQSCPSAVPESLEILLITTSKALQKSAVYLEFLLDYSQRAETKRDKDSEKGIELPT